MRVVYTPRLPERGSGYKYRVMFERVVGPMDVTAHTRRLMCADLGIVFGDARQDYRYCIRGETPYILVANDIYTMRTGEPWWRERVMFEEARAVLFTSEDHEAYCRERYDFGPSRVVHLRPLSSDLDFEPMPKLPGRNIVYAGGICPRSHKDSPIGYRAYHDIFTDLMAEGWTVHIYPGGAGLNHVKEFLELGCIIHPQYPEPELPQQLSQFQAGLQAYATTGPQEYVKACRPNKTWVYLSAGIPTLGINAGPTAETYRDRWGVVCDGDLAAASEAVLEMEIDEDVRREQVIDGDLETFVDLLNLTTGDR